MFLICEKRGNLMKISVLGLGYIGLPTSIMFAKYGAEVLGIDINKNVIESLNKGVLHIEEPGLQEEFSNVLHSGNLRVSHLPEKSDCFIIAVPTPNNNDIHKSCDNSYVVKAVNSIMPFIEKGNTIIIESTISPRTMDDVVAPIIETGGYEVGKDVYLVHCPERVLPGKIMHELIFNNRIVGGVTSECIKRGKEIYSLFVKGEIIETDAKTAEMSKLLENTYRDVNIALANEVTQVCNYLNIDALSVIEMANKHPRVNVHSPGPGVGGHCLAVDPYFISSTAPHISSLIPLSRSINNNMPSYIISIAKEILESFNSKKIGVLGLTYKGNVDDIRESPALEIYNMLVSQGFDVEAFDPHVTIDFNALSIESVINNSDLVLILSNHNEFKDLTNYQSNKQTIIFDTVNVVDSARIENYYNLGTIHHLIKNIIKSEVK